MSEVWDGLLASERGFVLAAALQGRGGAELCSGLAGASSARCGAVLRALDGMAAAERAAALGRLAHHALAAVPAGIEEIHPSWLEAAFSGERPEILRALLAGLPQALREAVLPGDGPLEWPAPEAVAELRRAALAGIAPALGGGDAARLRGLRLAELEDELRRRGAEVLGTSLRGSPREVATRAAALAGERWAALVLQEASRGGTDVERTLARELIARTSAVEHLERLLVAGALATAHHLRAEGGDEAVLQVAQRLPVAVGLLMCSA